VAFGTGSVPTESTLIKQISGCEMISFPDCETGEQRRYNAYVHETYGGAATLEDANKLYMTSLPEGEVRVKQDFITAGVLDHYVTYSPYFMRLPEGPYQQGRTWTVEHRRCDFAPDDTSRGQSTRRYRHDVVGIDEDVPIEGGDTYSGALHMKRTDLVHGDHKEFWYVCGVGKVREEAYDASGTLVGTEDLTDFVAGSGTCE
jgi:hypothetical protein